VPTNEQRRETAKRKLERQLERRAKQARMRRLLVIVGGAVAAIAVVAAVVITVINDHDKHKGNTAAPSSASNSPSSSSSSAPPTEPAGNAAPLPPFKASPSVGANCQYQATPQEPAAKPVKPPTHTGKIPTDPAQVSASMSTSQGNMGLMLANNESPCTVNSFASLIGQKYFDNTKCHRLTTSQSLGVLQCGDPKGDGTGGPGYQFANEYPTDQYPPNDPKLQQPVVYPRGTLAMANAGPGTNGSQFFMVYKDSELPPQYTVFGTIQADGLAVLDKIAQAGIKGGGDDGPPANEVLIKSILLD
jgi:peptidyl-prolyl cis-trans isomerase B (cyclophilin B)